ncbi:hypothetical protein KHU01_16635 [Morganella morganii]|nr:hypothetical protein [Morganella morganii subsp. morganii]QWL91539.1 hypothetical protein IZ187_11175 [Morganella morganii subsp. morganii]
MNEHISAKDKRSLRVADKDIPALPSTSVRRNKQLGFDNNGMPLLLDPAESGVLGYVLVDSFEKGAVITSRYQALHWLHNGEYYRWDGALPKTVPAGSTPDSAGGVGVGVWVGVGDASLRSELKKELVTESVKTDKLEITGSEITVDGSRVTFPDKDVNITNENIFIGDVRIGRRPGDIYLSPFPSFELDFGEFEANGAPYSVESTVGAALKKLSFAYRMDWGVVENRGYINLPNLYDNDGCGLYLRSGVVGDGHGDSVETITGQLSIRAFGSATPAPMIHDRRGAISAESANFSGAAVTSVTPAGEPKNSSQMVWFDSSKSSRGGAETRVKSRAMTPVIFLGVHREIVEKSLVINTSSSAPLYTHAYNAGYQAGNLTQSCLIKYGAVYTMHPYYSGSDEIGVVIGTHEINSDAVTLVTMTDKMRHQGLSLVSINGERFYISSANDTETSIKSKDIAFFKESQKDKISTFSVFDNIGSAMTSPSSSEDGEYLSVVQYDTNEKVIRIRVINTFDALINNELTVISDFTYNHPYVKGVDVLQCIATDKKYIYVLFGGLKTSDDVFVRKFNYDGVLIETYSIAAGKDEANKNHGGYIEPEAMFFLNGELYYMPVLGPTGKRVNPVYKIGDLV